VSELEALLRELLGILTSKQFRPLLLIILVSLVLRALSRPSRRPQPPAPKAPAPRVPAPLDVDEFREWVFGKSPPAPKTPVPPPVELHPPHRPPDRPAAQPRIQQIVRSRPVPLGAATRRMHRLRRLLRDRDSLRRAVLLREVLGRPRGEAF
jgi:hypothetical protein